jgi:hypothetical protein
MTPTPPPLPPEAQQEEARRQADSQAPQALETAGQVGETLLNGALDIVTDVAGAALEGTVAVAKVSLEVVGGILGGLGDL